jgi:carbonic anhydrase
VALLEQRVRQFHQRDFKENKTLYKRLGLGQNPEILFITCSDSRIIPSQLTQSRPGEVFVIRNAGNIIPCYSDQGGESATIEYALTALNIKHIIVCGHSQCGAMNGLLQPEKIQNMPAVRGWLNHAPRLEELIEAYNPDTGTTLLEKAIEENVLLQVEHLKQYPCVKEKLERNEITIHPWIYAFETGEVFTFNDELNIFEPLLTEETGQEPIIASQQRGSDTSFLFSLLGVLAVGIGGVLMAFALLMPIPDLFKIGSSIAAVGSSYFASHSRFFVPRQASSINTDNSILVNDLSGATCC